MVVVLPAPFGPRMAVTAARLARSVRPFTAAVRPYLLTRWLISTAGPVLTHASLEVQRARPARPARRPRPGRAPPRSAPGTAADRHPPPDATARRSGTGPYPAAPGPAPPPRSCRRRPTPWR